MFEITQMDDHTGKRRTPKSYQFFAFLRRDTRPVFPYITRVKFMRRPNNLKDGKTDFDCKYIQLYGKILNPETS